MYILDNSVCMCLFLSYTIGAEEAVSAELAPNRYRLMVFSDVFDDVCDSSPVFGGILREIKVFPFPLHPLTHF